MIFIKRALIYRCFYTNYKGRNKLKFKKISSLFLAAALCFGVSGIKAYAAEKTQDGIRLVISADKTVYDADDKIVANISLENNSGCDITDVTLEGVVPESFHLSDESEAVMRSTYVMSGKSVSSELVFIPDKIESKTTEKAAVTEKNDIQELKHTEQVSADTAEQVTAKEKTKKSGLKTTFIIAGILLLAAGGAVLLFRTKNGKKGIMILVCVTAAGSLSTGQRANADSEAKTMSVSESVSVAGKKYELTANVRFTMDKPDMQAAVEEYYEENSEEIVSVEAVEENDGVFSEKEAVKFMSERGFTEYPLKYDYTIDGTYTDEAEASPESDEKHPMYMTYFVAEDGAVWSVFIVGKTIAANPASYNLESDLDAQVLVSETETLTSYTEMGNKFYETIPKESAVKLKVVDKITNQKLNDLTYEEVIGQ